MLTLGPSPRDGKGLFWEDYRPELYECIVITPVGCNFAVVFVVAPLRRVIGGNKSTYAVTCTMRRSCMYGLQTSRVVFPRTRVYTPLAIPSVRSTLVQRHVRACHGTATILDCWLPGHQTLYTHFDHHTTLTSTNQARIAGGGYP